MEIAFFALLAYVIVESVALPIAYARRRAGRRRWLTYLIALIAAFVIGWMLLTQRVTMVIT